MFIKNSTQLYVCTLVVTALAGHVVIGKGPGDSKMAETSIKFIGLASGGELILGDTLNRNSRHISIITRKNESAETVAGRFVDALREAASKDKRLSWGPVSSSGGTLNGLPGFDGTGDYFLAGTESGLGIPSPPLSLTCCYDESKNQVDVRWINPPGGYNSIVIIFNWHKYDHRRTQIVGGETTQYIFDLKLDVPNPVDTNDLDICLVGYREKIPSNATAMHMSGNTQEELFGIPFTNGVAPNWTAWNTGDKANVMRFEQGIRAKYINTGFRYTPSKSAETKPFFQVIKAGSSDAVGGVWRKFLGLNPGHTYRVSARLNSSGMESAQGDWSFSLHAAWNEPEGKDFDVQQLAGLAPLPDGNSGPEAGQIAMYKPGVTTSAKFAVLSTNDEPTPGREISDVTLPPGVDTITVWVRHSGSDSSGVALDWIRLEDVSKP